MRPAFQHRSSSTHAAKWAVPYASHNLLTRQGRSKQGSYTFVRDTPFTTYQLVCRMLSHACKTQCNFAKSGMPAKLHSQRSSSFAECSAMRAKRSATLPKAVCQPNSIHNVPARLQNAQPCVQNVVQLCQKRRASRISMKPLAPAHVLCTYERYIEFSLTCTRHLYR